MDTRRGNRASCTRLAALTLLLWPLVLLWADIQSVELRRAWNLVSIHFTHHERGQLLSVTDPLGREELTEYDVFGRPVVSTDRRGHQVLLDYDAANRVIRRTVGADGVESYDDDVLDNLVLASDPGSYVARSFDALGRLTEVRTARDTRVVTGPDLFIAAGDSTYDNCDLVLDHIRVTVDGQHTFGDLTLRNGAVLAHSAATATIEAPSRSSLRTSASTRPRRSTSPATAAAWCASRPGR